MFLFSQFDFDLDINNCKIAILNSELAVDTYYEYQKTADIIVRLEENTYINIEMNREYFKYVEDRNSLFADKISQLIVEKGDFHEDISNKIFIQLNLNATDKLDENHQKIEYGEDRVVSYWENSKRKYNKNKIIVVKYLEYYRNLYYNEKKKLTDSEMWLVLLSSRSFKELYEISNIIFDIDMREEFMRNTITLMNNQVVLEDWQLDLLAKNARYLEEQDIRKESMEKGIQLTIINMLKENIDINTISKVTNKSKEEILEIKSKI